MNDSGLHICFVVTSDLTAGSFLRSYASEIQRQGHRLTIVCSPGPGTAGFDGLATVHSLPMRRQPSPFADAVALLRLTRLFRKLRPDIVVYATPKASLLSSISASLAGLKVRVYELWGLRMETAVGAPAAVLRALERVTIRLSSSVVPNSPSLAARARELGVLGTKVPVLLGEGSSHGVDLEYFSRSALRPEVDAGTRRFLDETEGFTVGFVGRLHPDKGIDVLLDAVQLCLLEGHHIRAILVGGDEGAELPDLSGMHAHVVGQVEDTRPYLAQMDVIVLMTLREGFPNVILEAASMEIPAIVADSTGSVDSVHDGRTGYVVPVGDRRAVADRIQSLLNDPALREAMGREARARVERNYSKDEVCKLHVDFYVREWSRRKYAP